MPRSKKQNRARAVQSKTAIKKEESFEEALAGLVTEPEQPKALEVPASRGEEEKDYVIGDNDEDDGFIVEDGGEEEEELNIPAPPPDAEARPEPATLLGRMTKVMETARSLGKRADFRGQNLSQAALSRGDFRGALFNDCKAVGADFSGANLQGANFTGAEIDGMDVRGANLCFAILPGDWRQRMMLDEKTKHKEVALV